MAAPVRGAGALEPEVVGRRGGLGRRVRQLIFALTVAAVASGLTAGGAYMLGWMETPEFCSSCHTMKPELQAYLRSPHSGVQCAECHIAPGVQGLVKAKLDGSVQMLELLTGSFPRPIAPAGHTMIRSPVAENCLECHRQPPSDQDRLVVRRTFLDDEQNTPQSVAVVVKLAE